jgi:hypothetical protein
MPEQGPTPIGVSRIFTSQCQAVSMISVLDLLTLLSFAALAWYWADALRCKEIARAAGQRACQQVEAQFLDDTVALSRLRLRRDTRGQVSLYREYRFEFTRNRDYRLRGEIAMMARHVVRLELEP